MKIKWKTIAIIFIVLFIVETSFVIWSVWLYQNEQNEILTCYYDICAENYDAAWDSEYKLCTCYELDLMGEYVIDKEVYTG